MNAPLVVAFGGGVNSAAMILGMHERGIRPDLIQFADTGGEKPQTYEFVDTLRRWTVREMGLGIVTVQASLKTDASLEDNCLRLGTLPSIVYGGRTCSQRWKLEPCEKYLNHWQPAKDAWAAGLRIRNAKGIDAGELRRAKDFSDKKTIVEYPLIEWGWQREQCVEAIERHGLPVPVKSACFYCPSSKKAEVLTLARDHPDLFARAVAMEHNAAAKLVNIKGLGRHWSWEQIAKADEAQSKLFTESVQVPCMCFDGDDD
jgi:hypothetical protein